MRGFYIVLTAIIALVHFWRLPHLIMENGGGAFLILWLLCLFGLALPAFIAELCFEKLFGQRRDGDFALKVSNLSQTSKVRRLLRVQLVLQIFVWVMLFQYFVYIGSLALIHGFAVLGTPSSGLVSEAIQLSLLQRFAVIGLFFSFVALSLKKTLYEKILRLSRWVLPLCLMIFVVILFQILSVGSHIEGVKTLLYPDFFRLRWSSFLEAVSHAFLSMALGMGWMKLGYIRKNRQDFVSIGINVASLSALFAIFTGLLAIPMLEQMSENALGANWLFFILPRWLMYGEFGKYYCLLFMGGLLFVSYFLCIQSQYLFTSLFPRRYRYSHPALFFGVNLGVSLLLIAGFYQDNWWALWDQSLILGADRVFVDILLPINAMMTVGFLFFASTSEQRRKVMLDQKIMFNAKTFVRYWRYTCCLLIPMALVVGWGLMVGGPYL